VQVSSEGPTQEVMPLTFYCDGIFVDGELWEYWRKPFPLSNVHDMFEDMKRDIDDEHAEFTRSLARRGSLPF
jgi:hypothetical protein